MTSASNYATVAQELYVAYFGRPADVGGLANIEAALANADTASTATTAIGLAAAYSTNPAIRAIVDAFGTSTESATLYGSNVEHFVTAVFESLFNRAPALSGLLFWENAIQTGATTMGAAALNILADASTADATTVAAKVFVSAQFTSSMVESAAAINAYQGQTAATAARSLLQSVTTANAAQVAVTTVSVTQSAAATATTNVSGVVNGVVTISDPNTVANKAGMITTVSLTNYGASNVEDNALTSLTLSGAGSGVTLNDNSFDSPVTSLTLNLNGLTDTSVAGFTDTHDEISVLNVVTGGATGSMLANITDSSLTTLAVSGTRQLLLINAPTSLTTVTVTGGAGLGIKLGASTSFTSNSTGTDIVEISATATKTVIGNGTVHEELIWNGAAAPAATTYLGTVTGFKVLGIGSGVAATASQVFDMSKITGFSGFDVQANSSTNTIQLVNVAAGSPLAIDGAFAGSLVYATADTVGPTDSVALTLGAAANTTGFTVAGLTLEDNAHFGIGTVSVTSNAATTAAVGVNTITNFQDASLTTLNVSGTGSLTISNNLATSATSLTVAATSGTGATSALTGTVTFGGGITDTHLTTLNLSGTDNISFGTIADGTTGITVSGASDNANISLALAGVTATGHTDSITLGNGNNVVTDTAAAAGATVNITLGNGNNTVTVGAPATNTVTLGTGTNNVIEAAGGNLAMTFGTHGVSTADNVTVGAATGGTIAASAVITGFNVAATGSDTITFSGDAGATGAIVTYTTAQINTFGSNPASLATAVAGVLSASGGDLAQHAVGEFTFQGNTYFVEQAGVTGSAFAAGDTVVELTGNQTITTGVTTVAAGVLHVHA